MRRVRVRRHRRSELERNAACGSASVQKRSDETARQCQQKPGSSKGGAPVPTKGLTKSTAPPFPVKPPELYISAWESHSKPPTLAPSKLAPIPAKKPFSPIQWRVQVPKSPILPQCRASHGSAGLYGDVVSSTVMHAKLTRDKRVVSTPDAETMKRTPQIEVREPIRSYMVPLAPPLPAVSSMSSVPPPPPPPLLKVKPSSTDTIPTTSTARTDLMETIRNADRSALRKVDREDKAKVSMEVTSSMTQNGRANLMADIGKIVEERRKSMTNASEVHAKLTRDKRVVSTPNAETMKRTPQIEVREPIKSCVVPPAPPLPTTSSTSSVPQPPPPPLLKVKPSSTDTIPTTSTGRTDLMEAVWGADRSTLSRVDQKEEAKVSMEVTSSMTQNGRANLMADIGKMVGERRKSITNASESHAKLTRDKRVVNTPDAETMERTPQIEVREQIKSCVVPPAPPLPAVSSEAPVPPPPPPPSLQVESSSTSATPTTGTGRTNLLEAIRNADKSALRKVDQTEEARLSMEATSPTQQDGGTNLLDAIGKMIEERRKCMTNSSEEDNSDESAWTE